MAGTLPAKGSDATHSRNAQVIAVGSRPDPRLFAPSRSFEVEAHRLSADLFSSAEPSEIAKGRDEPLPLLELRVVGCVRISPQHLVEPYLLVQSTCEAGQIEPERDCEVSCRLGRSVPASARVRLRSCQPMTTHARLCVR